MHQDYATLISNLAMVYRLNNELFKAEAHHQLVEKYCPDIIFLYLKSIQDILHW
jgi:hypothetical protein